MGLVAKQNSDFWVFWDTLMWMEGLCAITPGTRRRPGLSAGGTTSKSQTQFRPPGCLATVRLWLVFNRTFSPLSPSLRRELNLQLVTSGDPRPIVTSRTLLIRALKFKQDH